MAKRKKGKRRQLGHADEQHLEDLREKLEASESYVSLLEKVMTHPRGAATCGNIYPDMMRLAISFGETMAHADSLESLAGAGGGIDNRLSNLNDSYHKLRTEFGQRCVAKR